MAEDSVPTAEEYALFREAYAETYPVRPLLNAIDAKDAEIKRLGEVYRREREAHAANLKEQQKCEAERDRLRAALKRYEDLEIHLSTGGKPDERVYTRKDVEMLVAVCRAGERAAFETTSGT